MSPLKSTFGAASSFGWLPRVPVNPTLTNVEYTVWSGGKYDGNGGPVLKKTAASIAGGLNYIVTVGAAYTASSIVGGTIYDESGGPYGDGSFNTINGTTTTFVPGNGIYVSGYDPSGRYYYFGGNLLGGGAGSNGNGQNASNSNWQVGGGGGGGFTPTSAGLTNFPPTFGAGSGGGGGSNSPSIQGYDFWTGQYTYIPIYTGPMGPAGANAGNGGARYTSSNDVGAGSGGFTMRYSNTQLPLTSTTGTVVYLNSGGYHNYFWKSTGSFIV